MSRDASISRIRALLRHLEAEQVEHVVPDDVASDPASPAALGIIVAGETLPRLPVIVNEFCRRNDMHLAHHWREQGAQVFMLSWLNEQQRPEFLSVEVRTQPASVVRSPLANWWCERMEDLRRWRQPAGLLIACMGPQGSGRGGVIAQLCAQPLAPFLKAHTMELRPHMMRPVPVNPDSRIPRGSLGIMAKLMMFVADYWIGYWLQIRPKLVGATLVVSNRYYDDVLVDPRRYRIDRPRALARLLLPWIPRPELWLVFDVPSEVLQTRTLEVAAEEAARLRREYRRVLRRQEDVVVLDASQPLAVVTAEAERAIVAQLARRTARRLGLPDTSTRNPTSTDVLLFFCRRRVPVLSKLVRVLFNSDIHCRLPADVHMPHPYGIVIHPQAAIGHRVTVMQQVMIGGKDRDENIAPVIGDDVSIGAGARVLGDVRIGNGATIGANAVVTRDIPAGATVVGVDRIVPSQRPQAVDVAANAGVGVSGVAASKVAPNVTAFPLVSRRSSRP